MYHSRGYQRPRRARVKPIATDHVVFYAGLIEQHRCAVREIPDAKSRAVGKRSWRSLESAAELGSAMAIARTGIGARAHGHVIS